MVTCVYCGEEAKYAPLVFKPKSFIFEDRMHQLVNITKGTDLICLDCLEYEVNELKECY